MQTAYDKLVESGQYAENPEIRDVPPDEAFIYRWNKHGYLIEPAQRRMYESIASQISGLDICDAGSGSGLGSLILAQKAKSVIGVEIDQAGVRFASQCYPAKNLKFVCADIIEFTSDFPFDVVVAVELIEHIQDYHAVLKAVSNLLSDDGLLYISSPNRNAPSVGADKPRNRYHVREWTIGEFREILSLYFHSVAFYDHTLETQLGMDATLTPVLAVCGNT